MDERPRQTLARLMAGMPANTSPPANGGMSPMASFSPPTAPAPPPVNRLDFLPPFAGLKNEQNPPLPQFQIPGMPGGGMGGEPYMPPMDAPRPMPAPQAPPQMAQPAPMPVAGAQGFGGPEPAPGMMPAPYDPNTDPRYLPEQWRGAFNPRWTV